MWEDKAGLQRFTAEDETFFKRAEENRNKTIFSKQEQEQEIVLKE